MAFTQDIAPSKVTSEPLVNGTPISKHRANRATGILANIPVVLFGVLIFGLWWAVGGKYTIDGLPLLINFIGSLFHARLGLQAVTDWHTYLYLCWIPVCMSVVERFARPDSAHRRGIAWRGILVLGVVWLVVSALDFGSTYMAVTTPAVDAWYITRQVAASRPVAATWAAITTFLPEVALVATIRLLFKG
jgi:hypothetical protein